MQLKKKSKDHSRLKQLLGRISVSNDIRHAGYEYSGPTAAWAY